MVFDGFIGKEYREIGKPRGKHSDNSKMYQLKIALEGIEPKIWRRFLVEDSVTFHELHRAIQVVMGWGNYHAYEFLMEDGRIEGEGDLGFCVDTMWRGFFGSSGPTKSAKETVLNDLIKKENQEFGYLYDLGDKWEHSIVVEKIVDKKDQQCPVLLDGGCACPPEDCGGVYGYYEILEIQRNPSHPRYQERIVDWLGEDFDPDYFDVDDINERLGAGNFENTLGISGEKEKVSHYTGVKMRKLGRNEPCHCGSGKKYKKCCLKKDIREMGEPVKVSVMEHG